MSDRELLELAARAAGVQKFECSDLYRVPPLPDGSQISRTGGWNPLADDGDALRLAVKLRLDVEWLDSETVFVASAQHVANDDPYAATRRAIVRAAAEIGRRMT